MSINEGSRAIIRRAVPSEADVVAAITDAAYGHYVARIGRKPQPMVTDYSSMIAEQQVWLLDLEDQPVGVLVLVDKQDHLLIYSVAVSPQYQKRGLGRQLL